MSMLITAVEITNLDPYDGDQPTTYKITIDPNTKQVRCSCPAFQHATRIKVCKHMTALNDLVNPELD